MFANYQAKFLPKERGVTACGCDGEGNIETCRLYPKLCVRLALSGGISRRLEKIRSGRVNFVATTGVSPPVGGDQRLCLWKLQAFEKA